MTEQLPDFEEMLAIAHEVGQLTTKIALDKALVKELRAEITKTVVTDEEYWSGKKVPAFNYIQATFHQVGINAETAAKLRKLTTDLATCEGRLEQLKMIFQVYRDQIDVWKTKQFNKKMTEY